MRLLHLRQVLSNGLHGGTSATGLKQRMKYKIEIRMREYTFSFNPVEYVEDELTIGCKVDRCKF